MAVGASGDIRLVDGPSPWSGRVEVCVGGVWGSVCDLGWDWDDARVACAQLGYSGGEAILGGWFPAAAAAAPIHASNMDCRGNEAALTACAYRAPAAASCAHRNDAGLMCENVFVASPPPAAGSTAGSGLAPASGGGGGGQYACGVEGQLRVVPVPGLGLAATAVKAAAAATPAAAGVAAGAGRVEVCSQGQWGSVCDDGWDDVDAIVACRQLGFAGGAAVVSGTDVTGANSSALPAPLGMRIWLAGLDCVGSEGSLISCPRRRPLGRTACSHREDVGVRCSTVAAAAPPRPPPPQCSEEGGLRLVQLAGQPQGAGRLEVCHNGRYGLVCDNGFGQVEARVACRQLGYLYGRPLGPAGGGVAGDPGVGAFFWMDQVRCEVQQVDFRNWFARLTQCMFGPWGGSGVCSDPAAQAVGLLCSDDPGVMVPPPPRGAAPSPPPPAGSFACEFGREWEGVKHASLNAALHLRRCQEQGTAQLPDPGTLTCPPLPSGSGLWYCFLSVLAVHCRTQALRMAPYG